MKRSGVFWTGFAFLLFSLSVLAEEEKKTESVEVKAPPQAFPFVGKIKGRKVNVRGGGNTNYEILSTLEDGQLVIALSEAFDWYQILPPEGSFLWIHQNFLNDQNQVTTDRVNVRNAASLYATVNCQLDQGKTVERIEQAGEWIKIKPPQGSSAWVHKNFVLYEKPYEQHLEEVSPEKKLELLDARKKQLIQEAEAFEKSEFEKPVDQIQFDAVVQKYESILKEYAEAGDLETIIDQKVKAINEKKSAMASASSKVTEPVNTATDEKSSGYFASVEAGAPASAEVKSEKEPEEVRPESQKEWPLEQTAVASELSPEPKAETSVVEENPSEVFEGRLERFGGLGESSNRFKLIHGYRRVCVVIGDPIELKKYLHRNVRLQGVVVSKIFANVPLVEVRGIELASKEE